MEIITKKHPEEPQNEWDKLVEASRAHPIATLEQIYTILDQLNTKTTITRYEFHLQPVIDGEVPPNVAPH